MTTFNTDNITNLLETFLDVQSRRAEVISSNIANADTPEYQAKELEFEEFLQEAAKKVDLPLSRLEGLSNAVHELQVVNQTPTKIGLDGNTVDVGREMAGLAETGVKFNLGAKMLQSRLRLIRTAINEGR